MAIQIPKRKGTPKTWPFIGVTNPGKGLNNVIGDEYIANEEASSLENIMFVESGCPAKRNGHTAVGTGLSNNPKGLASFYPTSSRYLLTVDGTSLKYLNGTVWTAISGASFTTAKNTTFCQARGNLYIWNGTDAGRKLDSTLTLTAPTTTVSGSFGIFWNGRQWASGVAAQPSRVYVSNSSDAGDFTVATGGTAPQPDNATDAPGASVFAGTPGGVEAFLIDISKDDGDKVTGFAKFFEQLIIFKERSSWSVTLDSSGLPVVKQVSASVGCVSHRSIDNVDDAVFFLSRQGYYTLGYQANYTQAVPRTNELSITIHPIIDTITAANLPTATSLRTGYLFLSSIATGGTTTNNKTLVYDTRFKGWSVWTNVNANAFTEFIDSSNVKHLYYAADDEAKVYEIDTSYSDNGSAISAQWTSKAINFGDFSLTKQVLYIDIEFRQINGSVNIGVYTDGNSLTKSSSISSGTNNTTGTFGDGLWGGQIWGGSSGAAETYTSVFTNYITNPNLEVDTTGWAVAGAVGGSIARITTDSYSGVGCLTLTTNNTLGNQQASTTVTGLTSGRKYVTQAKVKGTAGARIYFQSGMSGYTDYTEITATGGWDTISQVSTAASTSGTIEFGTFSNTTIKIDTVSTVLGAVIDTYFDGSSTSNTSTSGGNTTTNTYAWTGTANASTSTRTLVYSIPPTVTTSTVTGSNSSNVPYRIPVNKATRTIKLKVSNATADQTFTLLAFKIYYRPYNVQKFNSAYKLT